MYVLLLLFFVACSTSKEEETLLERCDQGDERQEERKDTYLDPRWLVARRVIDFSFPNVAEIGKSSSSAR